MRKRVIGNWKLNGDAARVQGMLDALAAEVLSCDIGLALSAPYIAGAASRAPRGMVIGAQDCSRFGVGAYTGEVSASMLCDVGATFTLLGHSERRRYFGDDEVVLAAKLDCAVAAGLPVVYCVGETAVERQSGRWPEVLAAQLAVLADPARRAACCAVAYEPVWAIGTGQTPTPEQVEAAHRHIAEALSVPMPVLYGGSANGDNADALLALDGVAGLLVGGASLQPESFIKICRIAADV
jgi:triosephosphate isomerase